MDNTNRTNPIIDKLMNALELTLVQAMWVVSISEKHAIWIGNQLQDNPRLFRRAEKNLKKIIDWKKKNPGVNLRDYYYEDALVAAKDNGKTTFLKDHGSLENDSIVAICNGSEYKWVVLETESDCIEEGRYMHHCLADSSRNYLVGGAMLFSLRDAYNKPVLTLQIKDGFVPEYRAPHDADPDKKYAKYFPVLEKFLLKKHRIRISPLAKYDCQIITKLTKSERKHKGNLYIDEDYRIENQLPEGLHITGNLEIRVEGVYIPKKLRVDGNLILSNCDIDYIPNGTKIGKNLHIDTDCGCFNMEINLKKIKLKGKVILEC